MTREDDARIAYEAYADSHGKPPEGGEWLAWPSLLAAERDAWRAVVTALGEHPKTGTPYVTVIDTNSRRWNYIADAWLVKDGRLIVQSGEPESVHTVAEFTAWIGVNHSNDEYSREP